ncbi:hypothetical protein [Microcystis aeruginosa]|uniref:hypothetical protein n=1 Tax=Microcystis aeruginosa TaxID=1126 RepID=UPI0003044B76|nr:hypothetical protein [Microcystis aeruginosa]
MTKPIRAQSPLKFLAPHFNPLVLAAIYRLLPFYLRSQCQIERVEGKIAKFSSIVTAVSKLDSCGFCLPIVIPALTIPPP